MYIVYVKGLCLDNLNKQKKQLFIYIPRIFRSIQFHQCRKVLRFKGVNRNLIKASYFHHENVEKHLYVILHYMHLYTIDEIEYR